MTERRAPVQRESCGGLPHTCKAHPVDDPRHDDGTISWDEHVEAWNAYGRCYGRDQSAERLAERGGFGYGELVEHLGHAPTTWQPAIGLDPLFYFGDERFAGPGSSDTHAGHFLYAEVDGRLVGAEGGRRGLGPWSIADLDGRLARVPGQIVRDPVRDEEQEVRVACLHHGTGPDGKAWMAVSFWDRTGDRRGGSSSTVLCQGTLSLAEMLNRLRERLPGLWRRITGAGPIVGHPLNREPEPRFRVEAPKLRVAAVAGAPATAVGAEVHVEEEDAAPAPPRRAVL